MNYNIDTESSNDDEAVYNYFENPQKRKQFDNNRLYQQQKELYKMSGYNNKLTLAVPQKQKEPSQQRNYATVSLCYLTVTNPFRDKIIQIVTINPWFDRIILLVILINCAFLAIDDDVWEGHEDVQIQIEYIFLFIYTVEMIVKIIAMGFVCRPHSYLRDAWNVLDFLVVVLGWWSELLSNGDSNISSVRVVRLLRPLRTINSMPGMSSLVSTLINSLPTMLDIFILFLFQLLMCGTVATQLFKGKLRFRCMEESMDISDYVDDENRIFCYQDTIQCPTGLICKDYGNPKLGTVSFDNIMIAVLNIFEIITLEGWTDLMYMSRQASNSYSYDFFYIVCVISGTFFVLNLMIAVQFGFLGQAFDDEQRRKKELEERESKIHKQIMDNITDPDADKDEFEDEFSGDDGHEFNDIQNIGNSNSNNSYDEDINNINIRGIERQNDNEMNYEGGAKSNESQPNAGNKKVNKERKFGKNSENAQTEITRKQERKKQGNKNSKSFFKRTFCRWECCGGAVSGTKLTRAVLYMSEQVKYLVESDLFTYLTVLIICVNTVFLAIPYYGMSEELEDFLEQGNFIFSIIFIVEMCLKLFGLGLSGYMSDWFNIFDGLIVIVSIIEMTTPANAKGFSVLRSFRLLRVFKIVRSWDSLRVLLKTVINSFGAIANLGLLMALFLFIYALIAKTWFPGDLYDEFGEPVRYNFRTTSWSLITLFIVLTGENWNEIMRCVMYKYGDWSSVFFISMMMLGNFMLLNLFLAILLKFISENQFDDEQQNTHSIESDMDIEQELKQIHEKVRAFAQKKTYVEDNEAGSQGLQEKQDGDRNANGNPLQSEEKDKKNDNKMDVNEQDFAKFQEELKIQEQLSKSSKKGKQIKLEGYSLFCFGPTNCLRIFFRNIIAHPFFESCIYMFIFINSIMLACDEPGLEQKSSFTYNAIAQQLYFITIIFIVEAMIKIIVYGFLFNPKSYLKDPWNLMDFILVCFSIGDIVIDRFLSDSSSVDITFIKGFRALRALRPLRMVSQNEGMKIVVNSLLSAIPSLMNVLLISLLFYLVFGILGVQLLKGSLGRCTDLIYETEVDCLAAGQFDPTIQWWRPFNNYDNIFYSTITFFEISTLEQWPGMMYDAIDSQGPGLGPKLNNRPIYSLLYISFIFITTFFVMNLFISVIVDKFNEEIKKNEGQISFTEDQKEWVKMQRLMVTVYPKVVPQMPHNLFLRDCFSMCQDARFEIFIIGCILLNSIILCMDYYDAPPDYQKFLDFWNNMFVLIFFMEAVVKISSFGFTYYWHVNWNKFDFIVVILSLLGYFLTNVNVTVLRIIRVVRLVKMIKTSKSLRGLIKTLYMSLPNIINVGLLLCLIFFTFSVAGMTLFGDMEEGEFINAEANFKTFFLSMMTLIRAATGESWNGLMHDCNDQKGFIAIVFWTVFQLFTFFIFMNVFIAVVYENFNDIQSSEDQNEGLSLKKQDIKNFLNTWAYFNPSGQLYMDTHQFPVFMLFLDPPLGYKNIKIEETKLNKIIFCLNIKDHQGTVYFPEVLWAIFHSIIGNNDQRVHECTPIKNIMKILKYKYKGLGKHVTPDSLCGNKFYKDELTVSKFLSASKIYQTWKRMKNNEVQIESKEAFKKRLEIQNTDKDGPGKDKTDFNPSGGDGQIGQQQQRGAKQNDSVMADNAQQNSNRKVKPKVDKSYVEDQYDQNN